MTTDKEIEFDTVSDEYRSLKPDRTRATSPLLEKLYNQETLFVKNAKQSRIARWYDKARKRNMKLHMTKTTIDEVEGYVVWMESLDQETTNA